MLERYLIIGNSGHSFVVQESLQSMGIEITGYFEKNIKLVNPNNISYLGLEKNFSFNPNDYLILGIGDNQTRMSIAHWALDQQLNLFTVIDASAVLSKNVLIGEGSFIGPRAVINSLSDIGKACIVNSGAIIEHESSLGDAVHIAPGAVLCGNVEVGMHTLIGANATVLPGIKIGKNCVVGAGTVVVEDILDNTIIKGNPGKMNPS